MKVRVTVVLESQVETVTQAASVILELRKRIDAMDGVSTQSWKEQIINR